MSRKISTTTVGLVWLTLILFVWFSPIQDISISERRKLAQFPNLTMENIISGDFMEDFEDYAKDQFPYRFGFRKLKSYARFYVLGQKDNNNIYIQDDYAVKLEYPLSEGSVLKATERLNYIYNKYIKDNNTKVFLSIIPDKGYFLSKPNGYPSMDYDKLFELVNTNTSFAEYIDIVDILGIDDYYKTDIHWKQENLLKVADKIKESMDLPPLNTEDYTKVEVSTPFYGVYYGHAALPMEPDALRYMTNDIINNSKVYNIETNKTTGVYDTQKLLGNDLYDVYLSGASAILEINNPQTTSDKELILFRDSFGSSLAPLLLDSYSKITMVDIRYISSDLIGEYVNFEKADVLFLYSTPILNSGSMFK